MNATRLVRAMRRLETAFFCIFWFLISNNCFSQLPGTEWSTYLGGTLAVEGHGIATDGNGNIYIAGKDGSGGFVTKLSPSGQHLWKTAVAGGTSGWCNSVAVDLQGNVYVTGLVWYAHIHDGYSDAYAVKLSSQGVVLWTTYLGSFGPDEGNAITTDALGAVYVVGGSRLEPVSQVNWIAGGHDASFNGGFLDGFIAKLAPSGSVLWSSYLGGSGWDEAQSVSTDSVGNVYIAGRTDSPSWMFDAQGTTSTLHGGTDGFLVELSGDGMPLFSTYLGGGAEDCANALAIDSLDNIYVTGFSKSTDWTADGFQASTSGDADAFLIKFSSSKVQLWARSLGGGGIDSGQGIAVHDSDYIYVAGFSQSPAGQSGGGALASKFTSSGDRVWSVSIGSVSGDVANGVAVDAVGNAYLTGKTVTPGIGFGGFDTVFNGGVDAFVSRLKSNFAIGSLSATISPQSANDDGARWRRVGTAGWRASGEVDAFIPAGSHEIEFKDLAGWYHHANQVVHVAENSTTTVAVAFDDIVCALNVSLSPAEVVAKGAQWRVVGTPTWHHSGEPLDPVPLGPIQIEFKDVIGWSRPAIQDTVTTSGQITLVAATYLPPSITLEWNQAPSTQDHIVNECVATDLQGDVYVAGSRQSYSIGTDIYLAKYSREGVLKWATGFGGTGPDRAMAVATDVEGNVYIAGQTDSADWISGGYDTVFKGGGGDGFVMKLSGSGTPLWSTYVGGTGNDFCTGVAVDGSGNVFATGCTDSVGWTVGGYGTAFNGGNSLGGDSFAVKISKDGEHLWSTYVGGGAADYGYGIAVDRAGNAYVGGGTYSAGWTSGGFNTTFQGAMDGFIVKIYASGQQAWSSYCGGGNGESSTAGAIAADADGNTYFSDLKHPLTKLSTAGDFVWSKPAGTGAFGLDCDAVGNIYAVGFLHVGEGPVFNLTPPGDRYYGGAVSVAKFTSAGTQLWAAYYQTKQNIYGYTMDNYGRGVAVDGSGGVYIAGYTVQANDYRVTPQDPLFLKIHDSPIVVVPSTAPVPLPVGQTLTVSWTSDAAMAGSSYYLALDNVDTTAPLIRISDDFWKPDHLDHWTESIQVPTTIPPGFYRLAVVSTWLENHPDLRPGGVFLGEAPHIYSVGTGSLSITIEPAAARDGGARWRRSGTLPWFESGAIETDIPVDEYTIEFKQLNELAAVDYWNPPYGLKVSITNNKLTTSTATYNPRTGGLRVTISPPEAASAGAQWAFGATSTQWQSSGRVMQKIYPDYGLLTFNSIPGWLRPADIRVSIIPGQIVEVNATYHRANVVLDWSTYLGQSMGDFTQQGIALDGLGNVYVAGTTNDASWLTTGPVRGQGVVTSFVAKLTTRGQLIWSRALAAGEWGAGKSIAIDSSNNVLIAGGGITVKLMGNGTQLWSYAHGGNGIAVDQTGNVYLVGDTITAGWTSGGYDTSYNGGRYRGDGYVIKLSNSGVHLWSSYLGGSDDDYANAVAVDGQGNVFVMGTTLSDGWISGGFQPTYQGKGDAFVAKLSSAGQHLWSTYLGGAKEEYTLGDYYSGGIAIGPAGEVFVCGASASEGWTSSGFDTANAGKFDAFVAKLSNQGDMIWSTFLGGAADDFGEGIVVDAQGNTYVTGRAGSVEWLPGTSGRGSGGEAAAFLAKLTGTGDLVWSMYLGGNGIDRGSAVALSPTYGLFVAGYTTSSDWTSGGFDTSYNPGYDVFVAKLSESFSSPITITSPHVSMPIAPGSTLTVDWDSSSAQAGSSFYLALAKVDGSTPPFRISENLWKPGQQEAWEAEAQIPSWVPPGPYRLRAVSTWLEEHPELRPQGFFYGESAAVLSIEGPSASTPRLWAMYD